MALASLPHAEKEPYLITSETKLGHPIYSGRLSTIHPLVDAPGLLAKFFIQRAKRSQHDTAAYCPDLGGYTLVVVSEKDMPHRAQFQNESRALASLSHPCIIKGYAEGSLKKGTQDYPYVVLERINGSTLQDLIKRKGALAPEQVLPCARDVASALVHLHVQGLVHKDLKPENIIIVSPSESKLIDFGCARPYPDPVDAGGVIVGTPFYMSPEQTGGGELDGRSDIYSFGITLYCALVGTVPIKGSSELEVLVRKVHQDIPDPCVINPALHPGLGKIIRRAAERDVRKRYLSMEDVLGDLEGIRV